MSDGQPSQQFDETLLALSRVIGPDMEPEAVAIQALNGVEFNSAEAATQALRGVAAAIRIVRHGPVRARPVLVAG